MLHHLPTLSSLITMCVLFSWIEFITLPFVLIFDILSDRFFQKDVLGGNLFFQQTALRNIVVVSHHLKTPWLFKSSVDALHHKPPEERPLKWCKCSLSLLYRRLLRCNFEALCSTHVVQNNSNTQLFDKFSGRKPDPKYCSL